MRGGGFANYDSSITAGSSCSTPFDAAASQPLGVKARLKRADVLLLGHGHSDHMSDAASIGARTGAVVVGAPVTTEKLTSQSLPARQIKTVTGKGGEVLTFDGFTVEPILGRHSEADGRAGQVIGPAIDSLMPALTAAQKAEEAEIRSRGTTGPRVITEGTIAFLITLDSGFGSWFRDSAGAVTDYDKAAWRAQAASIRYPSPSAPRILPVARRPAGAGILRTYKPEVVMPRASRPPAPSRPRWRWRSTRTGFQARRTRTRELITLSRGYREPVCFGHRFQRFAQPLTNILTAD